LKKRKRENAPLKLSLAHWNINNLYLLLLEGLDGRERDCDEKRCVRRRGKNLKKRKIERQQIFIRGERKKN
jgi:hypothetical protein